VSPDISAALAWDAGMLAVEALRAVGPNGTPEQVRAFLAGVKDWGGINGIYDFAKVPQRGLDENDAVVTRWEADQKTWTIVSKPGGLPF
jgi:branched-chain amino acid transport system substrate-binding protein